MRRRRGGEIHLWRWEACIIPRPTAGESGHGIRVVIEPGRCTRRFVLRLRCAGLDQRIREAARLGRSLRAVRKTSSSSFHAHRSQSFLPLFGLLHLTTNTPRKQEPKSKLMRKQNGSQKNEIFTQHPTNLTSKSQPSQTDTQESSPRRILRARGNVGNLNKDVGQLGDITGAPPARRNHRKVRKD